jgi:hypothetical protein
MGEFMYGCSDRTNGSADECMGGWIADSFMDGWVLE